MSPSISFSLCQNSCFEILTDSIFSALDCESRDFEVEVCEILTFFLENGGI